MALRAPFTSLDSDINAFLFAPVGKDGSGMVVTVATAMAREGMDPREEAQRLVGLSPGVAAQAMVGMIAKLGLADSGDLQETAARLVALLPRQMTQAPAPAQPGRVQSGVFWAVCLGMVALFVISAMGDNPASLDATPSASLEVFPRHPLP